MCEFYIVKQIIHYIVKQIIYLNDLLKTINHSFKIEITPQNRN